MANNTESKPIIILYNTIGWISELIEQIKYIYLFLTGTTLLSDLYLRYVSIYTDDTSMKNRKDYCNFLNWSTS
jgi:hypothetical protein